MINLRVLTLATSVFLVAQDVSAQTLEEIKVSTRRLTESLSEQIYSSTNLDQGRLDSAAFGLDDALRRVSGFGLFRRQASRAAHPTTQGVSLRGLGPNGAGRTLVLLDGVPQNDPFGGWIEWVHLPPVSVGQATVVRGGGAGPWGNAALAGVVRLDSRALADDRVHVDLRYGSKETFAASTAFEVPGASGSFFGSAHVSDTDGYFIVGADQRGAADRPLARQNEGLRLGWRSANNAGPTWSLVGSAASDSLVNGSDVAGADTSTYDVALTALDETTGPGLSWQSSLYVRHKDFSNVFSAFDANRDTVRPVLNQFDVPATAVGGNAMLRWQLDDSWTIESGADFRFADGETNEQFRNLGAGFTRQRTAGGDQFIAGTYVEGHWQKDSDVLFTFGVRLDRWQQRKGLRRETDLADGSALVERTFANRGGWVANGRAGVKAAVSEQVTARAAIYSGFRVPTINELYRPFRVGNDITEANQLLANERLAGAETGLEWRAEQSLLSATVYRNDLLDPIINATITTTPGFNADFGVFIPGGGSLRQRQNINRVETWGLEVDGEWIVTPSVTLRAGYLFTAPKVKKSDTAPGLVGNRLAQVAKHQGVLGIDARPSDRLSVTVDVLASGRQFEDDLNSRVLKDAVTVDAQVAYRIIDEIEFYFAAENLFDARIEAGRSASGLVTLGAPMVLWAGMRLAY